MMKSSSYILQAKIERAGVTARVCLAAGQCGKVLAAFSNAIYLLTDTSELIWMVSDNAPAHRRYLKISTPLPGLVVGAPFYVDGHCLKISPGLVFDFDNALLWQAPQFDCANLIDIAEIPSRVPVLLASLDLSQVKGFGNFIPDILSLSRNGTTYPHSESADPVLIFARPLVLDMARACLENQPSRILQNTDALIGLGAGLTPSGDDFLGGLLFCIKILHSAYPDSNLSDHAIALEPYRARTHWISFAMLNDLASGHALAPLHHIINGILAAEPFESIHPFVSQLTQVGHSTGWDLLAGLLTALLTTRQRDHLNSSFRITQAFWPRKELAWTSNRKSRKQMKKPRAG